MNKRKTFSTSRHTASSRDKGEAVEIAKRVA